MLAIGASAGGLAAIQTLLAQLTESCGLAIVVVVHLAPDQESHLVELLLPRSPFPVEQVVETVRLEPDHVYVIPPNANLDAIDTHLRLSALEGRAERAPIDHFFRTLARSHGERAIGVVLSGAGSDGTLGLRQIKERGGLTLVQDPSEAEYDGMPRSAIAAAPVDLVIPASEIPLAAMRFAHTKPNLDVIPEQDERSGSAASLFLHKVFAQVRARTGRDFSHYKSSTMARRIARRMQLEQIQEPEAYVALLRQNPEEARTLADDLLITVTNFFRDPEIFAELAKTTIPRLFDGKEANDTLRVWSVGCATGEEAYSLAMLLAEEAGRRSAPPKIQIFASDLHEPSLDAGREGLFPGEIGADVASARLERFFQKQNGSYRVRKELREMVLFAPHNVLADPPFSQLDLIACRNVLIYFNREIHPQLAALYHYALRPGGSLVLGTSESMDVNDLFHVEGERKSILRKRDVPGPEPRLPVFPLVPSQSLRGLQREREHEPVHYHTLHQRIIAQHSAPSILVSPDDHVLHVSGHAGRFLVQPEGPITSSVFKLVRPELRFGLHGAIPDARRTKRATATKAVSLRLDGDAATVVVHAQPALEDDHDGFVVVQFDQRDEREEAPRSLPEREAASEPFHSLVADKRALEQRLQQSIEEHEASQEELKASNEELQSANEELRSTLEELETSKEELQSINEELQTVNQENRHKVDELAQLSNDLQNLLVATDIGTLFLDRELRILRFTPKVEDLFHVRATDRGRPITDFTSKLGYDRLSQDAHQVLERLVPIEHEIEDITGRWYLTRVLPYRTAEDRIAGVVVTFVEITKLKEAEAEVRHAKAAAERIIESLPRPLLVLSEDLRVQSANAAFLHLFDVGAEETIGFPIYTLGRREWDIPELRELLEKVLPHDQSFDDYLVVSEFSGLGRRAMLVDGRRLDDMRLILLGIDDITDRHDMERALRASEERLGEENRHKDEYLAMLGHELRNPLGAMRHAAELLRNAPLEEEPFGRAFDVLDRQSSHMSRIIDGLLDVSRIARGKVHLERHPLDLRSVVHGVVEAQRPHTAAREVELLVDTPSSPVWVSGDEARLAQVFDNLVSNALKFTDPPGEVAVSVSRDGGFAVARVCDTGVGIREEMLPRVFEAFRQETQDPARTTGGLGLGLALSRGLVELHEGTIEAHSDGPGHGTEMEVRLPLGAAPDRSAPSSSTPARPRRVLVVEDSVDAAEMLQALLELRGHTVTVAGSGVEALRLLGAEDVDVVICDLGLPGISGDELARTIRADASLESLPLIALTGYGQPEDRKLTAAAGFDDHLVKPVDVATLNAALKRLEKRDLD